MRWIAGASVLLVSATFSVGQDDEGLQSILVPAAPEPVSQATFDQPVSDSPAPPEPSPDETVDSSIGELEELPEASNALPTPPAPGASSPQQPEPPRAVRNGPIDRREGRSTELGVSVAGVEPGVKIVGVIVGGAAAQSGLKLGDIIESINGTPVFSAAELVATVKSAKPPLNINLQRAGQPMAATVNSLNAAARVAPSINRSRVPVPAIAPATRTYSRRVIVNAPGVSIRSEGRISSGLRPAVSGGTRIRISAPPVPVPPIPRRVIAVPVPVAPRVPVIRPAIPRPPIGPPRVIRRRFGF